MSFQKIPENASLIYDLPQEAMAEIAGLYPVIGANPGLSLLARFWSYLIFHQPPGTAGAVSTWPLPVPVLGDQAGIWPLAILVSGAERAFEAYRKLGMENRIALETLAFGGLYTRDYYRRNGRWGLSELNWLRRHVQARIFRLGRLVFNTGTYSWPFMTVRNRESQIITLCDGDVPYRADGLPDGTNNRREAESWLPVLQKSDLSLVGHPVASDGTVQRETIALDPNEWRVVLRKGDRVVDVHIPSGSKLSLKECEDAYREAYRFFPRYFPGIPFKAFVCKSWIMDPALSLILPPESNLVKFQRMFKPLPVIGDERQTYELVFDDPHVELDQFTPVTSLQKAIIRHVKLGNRMRSSAGFRLWEQPAGSVALS
ncbi:acyltransferase domain-containing protein [Paenibacillus aurantius]|uniref:Acyltransferase domain-containing protein n=1 Tax=Paenibacillus aurantius TaxID=2918900 RepID=A0AA96L960_9BACL|nr:acyltransferase domain-containing protein [Paenibacillus aurantius]WNQ08828.1 acyltransferase domain-containing protein [Paenibacillus aurantius]